MTDHRKVIVHIAASADGYIARPDDDLEWLTSRPAPAGFYGMNAFMKTIDTLLLGRKTYEASLRLGGSSTRRRRRSSSRATRRQRTYRPASSSRAATSRRSCSGCANGRARTSG